MGLEPYEGRYTLQLQDWTERAYKKRKIDYVVVPGTTIDDSKAISVGQVLDAHGQAEGVEELVARVLRGWLGVVGTVVPVVTPHEEAATTRDLSLIHI